MSYENPEALAQELKITTDNDSEIYHRQTESILKNLITKVARGIYNKAGAVKIFMYLAETGARKYAKENGQGEHLWHVMFPIDVRRLVADAWRQEFEAEANLGNYDNFLPKKYQGKRTKSWTVR
jgi:hypothetical protein